MAYTWSLMSDTRTCMHPYSIMRCWPSNNLDMHNTFCECLHACAQRFMSYMAMQCNPIR